MCFETVIGLALLSVAAVGYVVAKTIARVNWPLFWFKVRGGYVR